MDIASIDQKSLTIPRSTELLKNNGITHVLSLTDFKSKPNIDHALGIEHQHFDIDDNALEDLLMIVDGLCAWINSAIATTDTSKVLVHCVQGISRSGAVAVAVLMQNCSLDYESALAHVRTSRRVVAPNSGFADQLRLWATMGYSTLEFDKFGACQFKQEYRNWKASRGVLLSKEEDIKQETRRRDIMELLAKLRLQKIPIQ